MSFLASLQERVAAGATSTAHNSHVTTAPPPEQNTVLRCLENIKHIIKIRRSVVCRLTEILCCFLKISEH
jgi:hypothetical protein